MKVIAEYPFYNKKLAKKIAEKYGIEHPTIISDKINNDLKVSTPA